MLDNKIWDFQLPSNVKRSNIPVTITAGFQIYFKLNISSATDLSHCAVSLTPFHIPFYKH